jgi:anaerobic magnesium-protoporphyrin IX monomethyl ester cyclase
VSSSASASEARVLLVDPYLAREDPMERKFVELYPSLGVLTLAAHLRTRGTRVDVVDLTFAHDTEPVSRRLRSGATPQLVGVHTKTLTFRRSVEIAELARRAGAFAVAGGPDAASRPEAYLDAGFDAVVPGEGEATLDDLSRRVASGDDVAGTPGVVVRRGRELVRGPRRPLLTDLDALPLPAWDLIDMEAYLRRWQEKTGERRSAVLTSRGCPFDCSWCSKPTFGRSFRQQSPARVIAELRALRDRYRVDYVRFCDDVFGIHRAWLEELLRGIERENLGLRFECLARVELLRPDLLARMKRAGLERVYLGVESGSQRMLDRMNRGTRLAQIERASVALRREGVRQFWFLMLGYPHERLEDIEATLRLFRRFSPEEYSVSIAVPVPGTRFFDEVKDRLRGAPRRSKGDGGDRLLFEAAYPETLYRWEQARFAWEAALLKARGRLSPRVLARLSRAADRLHERVAMPLLGTDDAAERPAPLAMASPAPGTKPGS